MSFREVENLNSESSVTSQDLENLGLNPQGVMMLVISYRFTAERLGRAKEINFVYEGVQISIKPFLPEETGQAKVSPIK
jgi:hypothetical protein